MATILIAPIPLLEISWRHIRVGNTPLLGAKHLLEATFGLALLEGKLIALVEGLEPVLG